jgi:type I restriction enzyme S subunit
MNPERLLAHFDRISEAPDAIPRLRQFILDLAGDGVRSGKLKFQFSVPDPKHTMPRFRGDEGIQCGSS